MDDETLITLTRLTTSKKFGKEIQSALDEIVRLELKLEAARIVLAALGEKAKVSTKKLIKLLEEAETMIKEYEEQSVEFMAEALRQPS